MKSTYARAGGYDAANWSTLVAHAGLYALFVLTAGMTPDPLGFARDWRVLVAAIGFVSLALHLVLTGLGLLWRGCGSV